MELTDLSLRNITRDLADLWAQHDDALERLTVPSTPEDHAAVEQELAACEGLIKQYIAAEIRKVDNIAGFYLYADARLAEAKAEKDRVMLFVKKWDGIIERLKGYLLEVLTEANEKRFESATHVIRRQANSNAAVKIDNPEVVPDAYVDVQVTIPLSLYKEIADSLNMAHLGRREAWESAPRKQDFSLSRIKTAIEAKIKVPGARLEKGEHVRIS